MAMIRGVRQHANSRMWAYAEWSDENIKHFVILGSQEFQTKEEAEEFSEGFAPGSYEHAEPGRVLTHTTIRVPNELVPIFQDHLPELIDAMQERHKQIHVRGFDITKDDLYGGQELALAAAAYFLPSDLSGVEYDENNEASGFDREYFWPWDINYFKPTPDDRIKEIIKAIAMGMAEIKRLKRAEIREEERGHN